MAGFRIFWKAIMVILATFYYIPVHAHEFTYTYEGKALEYIVTNDDTKTCAVSHYVYDEPPMGNLIIPETAKDGDTEYTVTAIRRAAFSGYSYLFSVVIPGSVVSIGDWAFSQCDRLTSITIPESVNYIGEHAFENCGLHSVTIPDSVIILYDYVFNDCKSLTTVTLGNSIKHIGIKAFAGCSQLISMTLPESVETIANRAFEECGFLSISIPNSVNSIGESAFKSSDLRSITLPDSLTAISDNLFYGCEGLSSVTIGNNVTTIGKHAFYNCVALDWITIPSSVKFIGQEAFGSRNEEYLYYFVTNINSVEDWLKIKFDGFKANPLYYGNKLALNGEIVTDLNIPEGVEKIQPDAFIRCETLENITLPQSLKEIDSGAFYACKGIKSITIPKSVISIQGAAFGCCYNLSSVRFEGTPQTIGKNSFVLCKISELYLADANDWCGVKMPVDEKDPIFSGPGALYVNDTKVVNLVLEPESGIVNAGCFKNAPVEKIRVTADRIKKKAFESSSMSALCLDVKSIEDEAFLNCSELRDIYSMTPEPPAAPDNAFEKYRFFTLYVPVGSKDLYKNSKSCWHLFPEIIETDFAGIDEMFKANYTTSGIDQTVTEVLDYFNPDSPYEIYNMNGMRMSTDRMSDLAPGIYILRQGTHVKKIAVK